MIRRRWRAYSPGRGESVTRGDRRQRELWLEARCRRPPAPANRTARLGFRVGRSTLAAGCERGKKDDLWLWTG
jgi:hypothetical protein